MYQLMASIQGYIRHLREIALSILAGTAGKFLYIFQFMVLGEGTNSCGQWTKGRTNRDDVARFVDGAWVAGFITAVNRFGYGPSDLSKGIDNDGINAWVDNFCAQHPLDSLAAAAQASGRSQR